MTANAFAYILGGSQIIGGISQKNSADRAAEKAQEAANFNADLIERDIGLLDKQSKILNANALLREKVDRFRFSEQQGTVIANYGYAGIDIAQGTPMRVLRQSAREFEYDMAVNRFNDSVTQMQIADAKENVTLTAELTRMEGGASAGALRAQGMQSLISGFGSAARTGYDAGLEFPSFA